MTRVGITGHRGLSRDTEALVVVAMHGLLDAYRGGIEGVTSLADGADQVFARLVLRRAGDLCVIVPAQEFRAGLPEESHATYDELLAAATEVVRLPFIESTSESHMAAADTMLRRIDRLIAVWDGKPARGYGGTADIVARARQEGLPVEVLWPNGAQRS